MDRNSAEPLYAQIAADLRAQIESGARVPGSSLPTEQALQEIYGVSRSVVRQGLESLARDRLISREQGRGTIVLPPHAYRRRAGQAGGLRQQIAAVGGELVTDIIGLELLDPPSPQSTQLEGGPAWRLERVRSIGGEPLIHMVTWIPNGLVPALSENDLRGGSLHEWMRTQGLDPRGGPRQLRAVACSEATAGYLGLTVASPVTLLEGVTIDRAGRVLEAFTAWHHPQVVFDLDAEVGQARLPANTEALLDELRALLANG